MAVQTYSTLTAQQRTYYVMRGLKRLLPHLPLMKDAMTETIPSNQGTTVQWRRWESLPAATSTLTEGVPPSEGSLTINAVTASLAQYGAFQKISDLLIRAGIDPAMANVAELEGEQAGVSIHSIMSSVMAAGTGVPGSFTPSVMYASTAVSRVTVSAAMVFNTAEVRKAVRIMEKANVPRFPDKLYHGSCTPSQKYDLKADAAAGGYLDIMRYSAPEAFLTGTLGEVEGVAWDTSTENPIFATGGAAGVPVHCAMLWGPNAIGAVDLTTQTVGGINPTASTSGMDLMIVPANTPSKIDPLQQYGVAGWKCAFVAKTLDEKRVLRIETGISAGG